MAVDSITSFDEYINGVFVEFQKSSFVDQWVAQFKLDDKVYTVHDDGILYLDGTRTTLRQDIMDNLVAKIVNELVFFKM